MTNHVKQIILGQIIRNTQETSQRLPFLQTFNSQAVIRKLTRKIHGYQVKIVRNSQLGLIQPLFLELLCSRIIHFNDIQRVLQFRMPQSKRIHPGAKNDYLLQSQRDFMQKYMLTVSGPSQSYWR